MLADFFCGFTTAESRAKVWFVKLIKDSPSIHLSGLGCVFIVMVALIIGRVMCKVLDQLCSTFVFSIFAIISPRKRELVLLLISS